MVTAPRLRLFMKYIVPQKTEGRRKLKEARRDLLPSIATGPHLNLPTGVITASDCPKTISIPWNDGLKTAQRFPHRSPEWQAWFGKRNVIESMNAHIKDSNWEAIDDGGRRRARKTFRVTKNQTCPQGGSFVVNGRETTTRP
jgi:hypothetical protein